MRTKAHPKISLARSLLQLALSAHVGISKPCRLQIDRAHNLKDGGDSKRPTRAIVENIVNSKHPGTVQELVRQAMVATSSDEEELIAMVKEMAADGSLNLQEPTRRIESAWDYLLTPTISMWLWTTLGVTALGVASTLLVQDSFPISVIRWLLGSILVLFLPGYALTQLLFPKASEMDSLERLALDIGLSLALVPLIGLVLNYTPWGIRFVPVVASISGFTVVFLMAAAARSYLQLREESVKP